MKVLLIFDKTINIGKLGEKLSLLNANKISIFPITSNHQKIHEVMHLYDLKASAEIELINSARLIDEEVDIVREKVSKWSSDLGDYNVDGRALREHFLLSKEQISTWWFSLLSEKNPLKTNTFFRLAQIQAVAKLFITRDFDLCISSVSEKSFSSAVETLCKRYNCDKLIIPSIPLKPKSIKERIRSYLNKENIPNAILGGLNFLRIFITRAVKARLKFGSIKGKKREFKDPILFVSYFPAVDKAAAKKGILKNRYAGPLQEKIERMGKKIIWLWMYVDINGYSYSDALNFVKIFSKKGNANFLIYEFMSLKILFRTIAFWLLQIIIFARLNTIIPEEVLYENLSIPEGGSYIKGLMKRSFVGRVCLEGILYFELYKRIFFWFNDVSHCIYYLEMHAWEKALNKAKCLIAPKIKTIGFQHTSLRQNYFQNFYHSSEIKKKQRSAVLPLPDILACNGDIPFRLMERCGYPNLMKVEAVRHLYLRDLLDSPDFINKENIVIIAGSIDKKETEALISMFYAAFPKPEGFKVWLKGHPALPFMRILDETKVNIGDCGYIIKYNSIGELLKDAKVLVVGESSIAIEALAAGCKVVIPVFSDSMFMSPLKGFEDYYLKVSNPNEMKSIINETIKQGGSEKSFCNARKFALSYWCLDKSLSRWADLLK